MWGEVTPEIANVGYGHHSTKRPHRDLESVSKVKTLLYARRYGRCPGAAWQALQGTGEKLSFSPCEVTQKPFGSCDPATSDGIGTNAHILGRRIWYLVTRRYKSA